MCMYNYFPHIHFVIQLSRKYNMCVFGLYKR